MIEAYGRLMATVVRVLVDAARPLAFWRAGRRTRGADTPTVYGPHSIERVAADVRRIRRSLLTVSPRASAVRVHALYLAYDYVLVEAADILQVPHRIEHLPLGGARDLERLQLEASLEDAGLLLDR
jgi:hypothetical protein